VLPLGILPGHLTAAHCLVQQRQHPLLGRADRRGTPPATAGPARTAAAAGAQIKLLL
jgi:hypothetical protein